MSIDNEDLLEEALRADLPTADVEARVRRRLLAAGVAVGQGVATTTAVASGAGAAGAAAKAAGLSWGLKLGLAAFVAIPTVGLLVQSRHEDASDAKAKVAAPQASPPRPTAAAPLPAEPAQPSPTLAADPALFAAPEPPPLRPKAAAPAAVPAPAEAQAGPAHPSQADFAAATPDAPPRAPRVGSTLAEETRLLDGAFAELAAGRLERARALVSEHETRFPAGLLLKERERAKTRISELSRGE